MPAVDLVHFTVASARKTKKNKNRTHADQRLVPDRNFRPANYFQQRSTEFQLIIRSSLRARACLPIAYFDTSRDYVELARSAGVWQCPDLQLAHSIWRYAADYGFGRAEPWRHRKAVLRASERRR